MINKYLEIYKNDKVVKEFDELYEKINKLTSGISRKSMDIGSTIQMASSDLLKSRRIFYHNIDKNQNSYYIASYGFGNSGFGYKSRWSQNLDYRWRYVFTQKKEILKHKSIIRNAVKVYKRYVFDYIINAINKLPNIPDIETYTKPFSFDKSEYYDKVFDYGKIVSCFPTNDYWTIHRVSLVNKREDIETVIKIRNVEHVFKYRHLYPSLCDAMKEHIKKLNKILDSLDNFMNSKEYKLLLKELRDRKLLKSI